MKTIAILLLPLFLAGCASTNMQPAIVKTEQVVVIPDRSLFNCPSSKFPRAETLTDRQVANLIVSLHKNNIICQKNMTSIWDSLETSKKIIEESTDQQ